MLPLHLFRRGAFTGVQLAAAAVSASLFALFLYLTLYLQNYLGYSPLQAGLRYLPITLVPFLVAPLAVALMARIPARALMAIGLAGVGAGLALMAGLSAHSSWTALLPGFIVAGIGVGLLNPVIADVAVSVVSKDRSGMAAGINDTFRQVAIAVGVAAWGAIFLARGADKIASVASGTPAAAGDHPRQLIEAASSGRLDAARGPGAGRRGHAAGFPERAQHDPPARRGSGLRGRGRGSMVGPRARDRARASRAGHRSDRCGSCW
jgi:MFS transporter